MRKEMKDSGIAWIGEIPSHWETDNIGSLYSQRNEKVSDKDYPPLSVSKMGVVPQLETAAKTDDGDNRKLVRKGDFAINSRSDRRGSCGISAYDGSVSLINTILTPRTEMNPRFYDWLFHTSVFADEFYKWGHGIVDDLWTTRWAEMKRISIVVPPIAEQQSIADFLDKKCGEIDEMVSLQEKIVEELKAYKQSVITEAVCKGLNPDVPMKDSGIEWIGQIPEGWKVCRVKDILVEGKEGIKIGPFGSALTNKTEGEGVYKIYGQWNIVDKDFTAGKNYISAETYNELFSYRIVSGDVLVSLMGTVGKCAVIPNDIQEGIMDSHVIKIRLNNRICSSFFEYIYDKDNSTFVYEQIQRVKKGSIMDGLNSSIVKSLFILLPPIEKQIEIADYLDTKCAEIDTLISLKQSKIDALKEYKKSIIYEYITGKKEIND